MNNIINCATEILSNTSASYDQDIENFIEDFKIFQDETDFQDLLKVFSKICKDNFDVSGFELYEIPDPSIYIFYNAKAKQMFNICINDFCNTNDFACITYTNEDYDECIATTIPEAIIRYNKNFLQ